ncbi:MAG: hypothetical protein SPL16_05750 [Eubacteriales bacterium]|nr:hypothetical protein [Clostridiales bacterium]MDY5710209.1 hypothetical protein [Eubacteriales bacterium]
MPAVMAAGFLCSFGCAKKTEADTFVMVDIGYLDDEQYGDDTTFVAITGYATPQPVVTPVPTPEPTPEPTKRPQKLEDKQSKGNKEQAEGKKDDKKDDKKAEAAPTPKPEKKVKTPYAGNYTKQSLSYESGSKAISFETTTLDGSSADSGLFAKSRITMVNIWTRT